MRSGWFFGTEEWNRYLQEYAKTRPECLHEWKSSPLADDHDLSEAVPWDEWDDVPAYTTEEHLSQVIDLRTHKWSDIRKSYHSIIHRAEDTHHFTSTSIMPYMLAHITAFGAVRHSNTFKIQESWIQSGNALAVCAYKGTHDLKPSPLTAALWIIYQGCAYYASGPSSERDVQHAVIWNSLQLLKARGVTLVDMGQIDGETEKERNIGKFKQGFGGEAKPFTIVRRKI
jgi:hypothetical protein